LKSHPEQQGRVEFEEFRVALAKLPADQRGRSCWSARQVSMKRRPPSAIARSVHQNRVNRARTRLAELLSIEGTVISGPS
jgi:RNA polymerase sigma-70 factor (ECF subfamily)